MIEVRLRQESRLARDTESSDGGQMVGVSGQEGAGQSELSNGVTGVSGHEQSQWPLHWWVELLPVQC